MSSNRQALILAAVGLVVFSSVPVLRYTLWEFDRAWIVLGSCGIVASVVGVYRLGRSPWATVIWSAVLLAIGYGIGMVFNRLVVDLFAWPRA
jgi:hypothetical protein